MSVWFGEVYPLNITLELVSTSLNHNCKVSIKRFLKRNLPHVGMVQCMNACTG